MFNEYTVRALTIRIISIMFGKDYEKNLGKDSTLHMLENL